MRNVLNANLLNNLTNFVIAAVILDTVIYALMQL